MREISGMIYTPQKRFRFGKIQINEGRIENVDYDCELPPTDTQPNYILPGLIDIHFHGCAAYDFCDGTQEAFEAIAAYESAHGITTICPATMTLPAEQLLQIVQAAARSQIPILRGINLEGPFLSKAKKGAQNEAYLQKANTELIQKLQKASNGLTKLISIAPEEEGALEVIRENADHIQFSIAHTCADYQTALEAMEAGATHVTHLYNAMLPFSHRSPGVVGAAFDHKETKVELICDGIHVDPCVVRASFALFGAERIILISDSMMAAGMEDGTYSLGGQAVTVKGNLATLADGTIAGSVTNLYDCMLHAIEMGIPPEDAIAAATINPAKEIGIDKECGSIEVGKRAELLVTDAHFKLLEVIL